MKNDPVITSVREARHRISESAGHDPKKLIDYYRKLQERHRSRISSVMDDSSKTNSNF